MAISEQTAGSDDAQATAPRPLADIQTDMAQTRDRLSGNIAQLKAETSPKALAGKAQVRARSVVVNPDGSVKTGTVAAIAGVALGLMLLRRGARARSQRKELQRLAEIVWVPVPRASVNPELAPLARNAGELAPLVDYRSPSLELTSR